MTSRATRRFWKLYHELPEPVQRLAVKNYRLWRDNPRHPALDFKKLAGQGERFSIRVAAITAPWATKLATAMNGFGLAHMKIITNWSAESGML
jgi:hypothetical protein